MWETVKLEDIADVKAGNPAPQDKNLFENGVYPFVRTSDVGKVKVGSLTDANDKLNQKGIAKLKLFPKGTILFPKSGASTFLNHRVILEMDAYVASHLATIKSKQDNVSDNYLWYFLQTIDAADLVANSSYPSLNTKTIQSIPISLPPLAEQERIVAKLDAAFAEIDRGIKTTKAKESEISRLNMSILSTTLNEHNHKRVKLGSITTVIAGQSPKSEYYNKEGRGTPFYQGKKDYGKRYLNEPTVWTDRVTKLAEKDDILLSVRAPVGALNISTQQICIGRGLAAIRPSTKILNDYLFYSLLLISNKLEGSSGAIFNSINKSQIEALEVPLPPIEEQQNIVDKLDAALEKIKLTKYSNEAIIKNFIKLKSAMLTQELQSSEAA
tara:strand:- start:62 stop:1210 length:1149 start_codon:yes stop_codon:yes gene_type:complete